MTTFLISDTHFFHAGIIHMCERPFIDGDGQADVRAMAEMLKANWNAVVRKDDFVVHLGDFAHRAPAGALSKLFASLSGKKILIKGNHDGPETLALPWHSVHDVLHTSIDSTAVTLCHYSWRVWPRQRRGSLMLYGHSHGRLPGNQQSMDIGVDVMGWSPVRLNQIKAVMKDLPPLIAPESGDDLENDEPGGVKP
jgi:calcineurin-like phosphoesterase family protein